MTDKIGEPLVYELSAPGRCGVKLPEPDVPLSPLPEGMLSEGMLRDASAELAGRSRFWIASIELDGDTIASEVFVRAGEVAADWLGGFDEGWARFSPGMLVMMAGIEHATHLDVSRVEFGAGRQPFKHRLSDGQLDLEWTLVVPPGPASVLATSLALARVARRRGAAAARSTGARLRTRGASG